MVALLLGVALCLFLVPKLNEEVLSGWVGQGIKDSAAIIMITAAGGSLGLASPRGVVDKLTILNIVFVIDI